MVRILFFIRLSFVLAYFCISNFAYSQVTIGSSFEPNGGSLLDLKEYQPKENNENAYRGLLLPRVELNNLKDLEDIEDVNLDSKDLYTGLLIYNVLENKECGIPVGLYVWNGEEWQYMQNTPTMEALSGSYVKDVAILKRIMDDNPNNTLDWVIDDSDKNDLKFQSGTGVVFEERCGEKRLVKCIVSEKKLKSLNLKGADALTYLDCDKNQLSSLNISGLTKIEKLICSNNQLTSLDTASLKGLKQLTCSNNKLSSLDLLNLPKITFLNCSGNNLSAGSISICESKYNTMSNLTPAKGDISYKVIDCK